MTELLREKNIISVIYKMHDCVCGGIYMGKVYVISVKIKDTLNGSWVWKYAGIDSGRCGSGLPVWCDSHDCKKFADIDTAKQWFESKKSFLFDLDQMYTVDMRTLGIREIIYKKIMPLKVYSTY